jgi:hypothetical protein
MLQPKAESCEWAAKPKGNFSIVPPNNKTVGLWDVLGSAESQKKRAKICQ